MEGFHINWLLIAVIILYVWRAWAGSTHGLVKEVKSFADIVLVTFTIVDVITLLSALLSKEWIPALICGIILMILLLAWKLIRMVFDLLILLAKIPVISSLNHILGFLLGILESTMIIWGTFSIMGGLYQIIPYVKIMEMIQKNVFLSFLYQNNYFMWVIHFLINLVMSRLSA